MATPTFEEAVEAAEDAGYRVWGLKQDTKGQWRCALYLLPGKTHHPNDTDQTGITMAAIGRNPAEAVTVAMDEARFTDKVSGPFGFAPHGTTGGAGNPIGLVQAPKSAEAWNKEKAEAIATGDLHKMMKAKVITTYALSQYEVAQARLQRALASLLGEG